MELKKPTDHTATSVEKIAEFESTVGFKFPDDYKAFLLEHNGGRPTPNTFSFKENGNETKSLVDWFFSQYGGKNYNLERTYSRLKQRIPVQFLPIACDPFGNMLLLSLRKEGFGNVYFWDHEKESQTAPTMRNMSKVADSFSEFINGLQPRA